MTHRAMNFNAGPAGLPTPVLERARDELLDFQGTGMSVMEQSHRGKVYEAVHREALSLVRSLLGVPDTHAVLLLQGGAHAAFALLPMNLVPPGASCDHVVTGHWGERAIDEANVVANARRAGPDLHQKYTRIPAQSEHSFDPAAAYVHITSNNTIEGTQYDSFPDTGSVPLVADMSSDLFWRPIDVSRFGVLFAGAQKNLGPSGIVLYIVRRDLLAPRRPNVAKIFRLDTHAEHDSLYNTPPTFAIYLVRGVLQWTRELGGLEAIERRNREKGGHVYDAIDAHAGFYHCPVELPARSLMNVVFRLPTPALEDRFVAEAAEHDMVGLKGHRSVGGIRVSLYNAVSPADARTLADFMREFARKNG